MTSDSPDPQHILDRALRVLDATVSDLEGTQPWRRDAHYVRSVTEVVKAAAIACQEQRAAVEWLAAHSVGSEEFEAVLRQYLARLSRDEVAGLLSEISRPGESGSSEDG